MDFNKYTDNPIIRYHLKRIAPLIWLVEGIVWLVKHIIRFVRLFFRTVTKTADKI